MSVRHTIYMIALEPLVQICSQRVCTTSLQFVLCIVLSRSVRTRRLRVKVLVVGFAVSCLSGRPQRNTRKRHPQRMGPLVPWCLMAPDTTIQPAPTKFMWFERVYLRFTCKSCDGPQHETCECRSVTLFTWFGGVYLGFACKSCDGPQHEACECWSVT